MPWIIATAAEGKTPTYIVGTFETEEEADEYMILHEDTFVEWEHSTANETGAEVVETSMMFMNAKETINASNS